MAPEMAKMLGYSEKVDVWACGILFYFLLSGDFPLYARDDLEMMEKLRSREVAFTNIKLQKYASLEAISLLKKLLRTEP